MPGTALTLLALILTAALALAGYRRSLRTHPYGLCRTCGGGGMTHGVIFTSAWRPCRACGGTGRRLRLGARSR
ncbi:hypothetical protein [Cryptosporangium japonicum]|uniref:Molecular chaperone DnaJ n=1 Tax=Cryptosporangium japonicum TaxID=80872 RepID=A0ABN0UMR6_9ACTN